MSEASSPRISDRELQRLRQACRLALERYVDVVSDEAGRLARLTPESITEIDRVNILMLSRKACTASEAFAKAKAALMEYLASDADSTAIQQAYSRRNAPACSAVGSGGAR